MVYSSSYSRLTRPPRHSFFLLGSSARKLKAAGVNLLAGRALRKVMYPLTPAELGDDFDLDAALQWGTIPLVWVSDERREVLESYVHPEHRRLLGLSSHQSHTVFQRARCRATRSGGRRCHRTDRALLPE